NAIIPSLGAIHCIGKEIGVMEPVFISHSAIRNTNNTTQPYEVKAFIKHKSGIASARMYWSLDTANGFTQVNMTNIGDTFRANIPAQPLGTKVYYYIWANSISGKTVTKPLTASRGNIQFIVTNTSGITNLHTGIPEKFSLYQNYPNPFNPSTSIKFNIPKVSNVNLTVYDIAGREIAVLFNQSLDAGTYKFEWNPPSNLSSGVYFYRLHSGNNYQVRKLILIK
ncbi:MAG TPA: T9SS type A sorting domain-containing protein, partial [Ignavibacteria bacterium]|nr:T9SS type A sorting domain-containing protein [Ignavibacteria bacterium]